MNIETLKESRRAETPPDGFSVPLEAMWYQFKRKREEADLLAQSKCSSSGVWVHAYLHRVEGDLGNEAYWYRKADRSICTSILDNEWEEIFTALG